MRAAHIIDIIFRDVIRADVHNPHISVDYEFLK